MCLVNCAKTMDLVQVQEGIIPESDILCTLLRSQQSAIDRSEDTEELKSRGIFEAEEESEDALLLENANKPDILSVSTQWTRRVFQRVNQEWKRLQKSTFNRILTKTSQPVHIVAVVLTCLAMYFMMSPATTKTSLDNHTLTETSPQIELPTTTTSTGATNKLALFGYLSTFAIQFGAQMWMTFVSGLALYFSLQRHTFGLVQRVLFPKYFALNASLGVVKLFSFCKLLDGAERIGTASFVQIILIGLATLIEAGIYLHLVEPLLNLMVLKQKYERMVGSGEEVGYENQKQLKASPAYQKVHKAFRRTHMIVAMGNLTTVACTFAHLYYMVQKIEFSC